MDLGYFETSLDVKDLDRSVAFYEALGFQAINGASEVGNVTMLRGDCRLGLYQGHLDPPQTQLIFWQGDIGAIAGHVAAQGLSFFREPKKDDEGGGSFMLKDPDGNPLYFVHMKTFYPGHPVHERKASAERPLALKMDGGLGWYEASLDVKDIGQSVEFYQKLGFEIVFREPKGTRVTMQSGDCRLGLFQGHLNPPGPQLIFWQGDIDALTNTVKRKGINFFSEPRREGEAGTFMLQDPDGHPLFFIRMPGVTRQQPDPTSAQTV